MALPFRRGLSQLAASARRQLAVDAVERAMAAHDRIPMPFERARTQLLLGQLERRQRAKDTFASFQDVLQTFEQLGTPLWADRARIELGRVRDRTGRNVSLSPSERRVAELAASGLTNRKIAAAMYVSPKTVESNLSRIYAKLGIRSRAELGRHVAQLKG